MLFTSFGPNKPTHFCFCTHYHLPSLPPPGLPLSLLVLNVCRTKLLLLLPLLLLQEAEELEQEGKFFLAADLGQFGMPTQIWTTSRRLMEEDNLYKFSRMATQRWCDDRLIRIAKVGICWLVVQYIYIYVRVILATRSNTSCDTSNRCGCGCGRHREIFFYGSHSATFYELITRIS